MQKPGHTHCLLKLNSHHFYILCLKGFSLFLLWSFLYLRSFLYILFCLSFSPGSHGCLTVFSRWLTIISQALWDKIGARVSFFFPEKELRKMSYMGCEALRERERESWCTLRILGLFARGKDGLLRWRVFKRVKDGRVRWVFYSFWEILVERVLIYDGNLISGGERICLQTEFSYVLVS